MDTRIKIKAAPSWILMPFKNYVEAKIKYFKWLGISYSVTEIIQSITRVQKGEYVTDLDVSISEDIVFE